MSQNHLNIVVFANWRTAASYWQGQLLYMLKNINIVGVNIDARFQLNETVDLIVFDIEQYRERKTDTDLKFVNAALATVKNNAMLIGTPKVLIHAADHELPDEICEEFLYRYRLDSDRLRGTNIKEKYADLVSTVCADALGKHVARNFSIEGRRIFISHSWKDKPTARRIATELAKRGANVWIDEAELKLGDSLIYKISRAIDEVDYFAVLISKNSVDSSWVQKELEIAMDLELKKRETVVLPILLDDCEIPSFLRGKLYGDMSEPDGYDEVIQLLLQRMDIA